MKKKIDNIKSRIESLEANKETKINEVSNNKKLTQTKLATLQAELDETEDPMRYKDISAEITDCKTNLMLLERSIDRTKADGFFLSRDEYKELLSELRSELSELQEEHAPKIEKKISELVAVMDSYSEEAEELQDLANRTHRLYTRTGTAPILETRDIHSKVISPFNWFKVLSVPYFIHREKILFVMKNPSKFLRNGFVDPDLKMIAKTLSGKTK